MIVFVFFVCLHVVILSIKRLSNKQHKPPYWWNTCSFLRLLHNKFNKGSEERTGQEEDEADRWWGVGAESDESEDGRHCMCCSVSGPHTTLNRTADDSKWSGTIRECVCVCVSAMCLTVSRLSPMTDRQEMSDRTYQARASSCTVYCSNCNCFFLFAAAACRIWIIYVPKAETDANL